MPLLSRVPGHGAWQKIKTLFGVELQAYTLAGNLSIQQQHVIFKGAVGKEAMMGVASELLGDVACDQMAPVMELNLVVIQARLGRSLHVCIGCLLEQRLSDYPWAQVGGRIEEICNNVLFTISNWGEMLRALNVTEWSLGTPTTSMVSLTSRGVLTVRITWLNGVAWEDNEALKAVTDALARFVYELV